MRMKSASAATEDKADKSRAERRLTWLHKLHWLVLYDCTTLYNRTGLAADCRGNNR